MVITPHVLVGVALGTQISNPIILAVAAVMSHYLLDMIPHWDYDFISSKKKGALKIAADITLSGIATFALIWNLPLEIQLLALWGGFWGIFPDGLSAIRIFSGKDYFRRATQLHNFWHHLIFPYGTKPHHALGISTQIMAVVAVFALFSTL